MTTSSPSANRVRVAVVGASGYTGAELVRLLVEHPAADIVAMTADRKAGQDFGAVFPHLAGAARAHALPPLQPVDAVDWQAVDVAFFGLPHGAAQPLAASMPSHVRMIDLSPDFRFTDPAVYAEWYGQPHAAPQMQEAGGLRAHRVVPRSNSERAAGRLPRLLSDRFAAAAAARCRGRD